MSESDYNRRLKDAVRGVEAPPSLETKIRGALADRPVSRSWGWLLAPAALAATVFAIATSFYHFGRLRYTPEARESYIASVSARVATLMRVGLGDHIHCAVFAKPPKTPPERIEASLGKEYSGLATIAERYVPAEYPMMTAHRCTDHGRHFVHLTFTNGDRLISLVIARKGEGESFEAQSLLPAMVQSGIPMYQSGVQRFAISAFESRDFLVYLISDLPPEENMRIMTAMAPPVKDLLEKL